MKTNYKDIYFEETANSWRCYNNTIKTLLGWTEYYKLWKQFIFNAADYVIFSADCLADISHFLKQLNDRKDGK